MSANWNEFTVRINVKNVPKEKLYGHGPREAGWSTGF
jgi:hypothetical protein